MPPYIVLYNSENFQESSSSACPLFNLVTTLSMQLDIVW